MFGHTEPRREDDNLATNAATTQDDTPSLQDDNTAGAYIDEAPGTSTVVPNASTATSDTASFDTMSPSSTAPTVQVASVPQTDQLLDIKQQALQQLTPLVGHLDQSAEERFRTTMMMIQASDNHELIATAYEAAQQITDEKARAQALLDIVNEINYFTQNAQTTKDDVALAA